MKQNATKSISLFLVLAMVLCTLTVLPFAASAEDLNGECGENLTWRYDSDTQTLYIEGSGEMWYESYNSQAPWHGFCSDILHVVIGDGATTIAGYAFNGCLNLQSVVIPDSVELIDGFAFYHCYALERVTIPDRVSAIGKYAFYRCIVMTEVTIGDHVASIGEGAFSGCVALTSVCIPESVTKIGANAFYYCTSLKYILAQAKEQPSSWEKDWNKPSDKDQYPTAVYWNCTGSVDSQGLVCANYPDGSMTVVDYTGKQNAVTVPEGAAIADWAFSGRSEQLSVTIPNSVTEIAENAFDGADVVIYGSSSSYAAEYAEAHGIRFVSTDLCPDGHTFSDWKTVAEATCADEGTEQRECAVCGEIETRSIPKLDTHTYGEWETVTEPTCTAQGSEQRECAVCGKTETRSTPATGTHAYGEWSTVTEPTCTAQGSEQRKCTVCGEVETRSTEALGHDFSEEWTIDTPATEDAPGSKSHHCTRCDEKTDVTEIPQLANVAEMFEDVIRGKWYYEAVQYAVTNGLFNGISKTEFKPNNPMNRAMLVSVLYRMEGSPALGGEKNPFGDVPAGKYYTDAVIWAASNDIVTGTSTTAFSPDNNITREQMATILYRYAEKKGYDVTARADLSAYPDGEKTSTYAKDTLSWANAAELITGSKVGDQTLLDPKGSATRAQVATILMRYQTTIAKK